MLKNNFIPLTKCSKVVVVLVVVMAEAAKAAAAVTAMAVTVVVVVPDLERSVERLSLLQDHDAPCLLKNALAISKLQYILRTSPCSGNPLLSTFDKVLRCGLSKILNVNLNDTQWTQATLPVFMGGLGVRSACMPAPSAFLVSAAATVSLQEQFCRFRYALLTT